MKFEIDFEIVAEFFQIIVLGLVGVVVWGIGYYFFHEELIIVVGLAIMILSVALMFGTIFMWVKESIQKHK